VLVDVEAMLWTQSTRHIIGEVAPGHTISVPTKFLMPVNPICNKHWALSLRPLAGETFKWGSYSNVVGGMLDRLTSKFDSRPPGQVLDNLVSGTSVMFCEMEDSSVHRAGGMAAVDEFPDIDLCNSAQPPSSGPDWMPTQQIFWMAIHGELDLIAREDLEPAEDWKLSIHAPIIIESQLPCEMAFKLFSRSRSRSTRPDVQYDVMEEGIIAAGGSEPIYSTSPQDPLYLTVFPSNTDLTMSTPLLISHPKHSKDLPQHLELKDSTGQRWVRPMVNT